MRTDTEGFVTIHCTGCDIRFKVTEYWWLDKYQNGHSFHCPNGCAQAYEETEADRVRRDRDRLKQRLAERDDDIRQQRENAARAWRTASAFKGQATKLRNRAKAGVCPCCNRQFQNLKRHMSSKHPDFQPDAPELEVIAGGKP